MVERLSRRLAGSIFVWDMLLTLIALRSSATIRVALDYGNTLDLQQASIPWPLYGGVVGVWTVTFLLFRPQRALFSNTLVEAIGRLLAAVALAILTFAGVLYLSFRDVSRLQFIYFAALDLLLLVVLHLLVRLYTRTRSPQRRQHRVLIVGSVTQAEQLVREFANRPWVGVRFVGYTGDDETHVTDLPWLGSIDATPEVVAEHAIDEVIFVTQHQHDIVKLSLQLVDRPVMLHMVPSLLDLTFARTSLATVGGLPLISLRESAINETQRILKRIFDIVGSAVLLIMLGPLMLLIAIAIKLDSAGPVFFAQERVGEHGRRFRMIKFRSMYADADKRWREVAQRDADGRLLHKRTDDPRITRIGQKLRRTSLDELPQLFNVLRGEMSLVGPRPEMPYVAAEYEPWQWQRFRVPPGMTGWWQVNGRSNKVMHLNTEDDLYYIQNYSFWLDLKILWMTLGVVVRGQGAY